MLTDSGLLDQYARRHDYLRISLTERCNMRCFYCMPEEGIQLRDKKEFMSTEEVLNIAKTFVGLGIKKIRLTGGEPLIKKDISQIIKELSKLPVELGITSNGILVDKYIDLFKESQMKSLNISLDSLKPQKMLEITRRDFFERIMANIHLLLLNNFEVKINVVAMKGVNDDEINNFVELTHYFPLHIRFIEFMPFRGNEWNRTKTVSQNEMMDSISEYFGKENLIKLATTANQIAQKFKIKEFEGDFGFISTITNPFCDSCNRIRLTADGKIKNCLFSSNESDLLLALRKNEDIVPLIKQSIWFKKKERAGIQEFNSESDFLIFNNNRYMTSIGG